MIEADVLIGNGENEEAAVDAVDVLFWMFAAVFVFGLTNNTSLQIVGVLLVMSYFSRNLSQIITLALFDVRYYVTC